MTDDPLRDEINKRLTLNWLIQGAAQHASMTLHHQIREELNSLDPKLLRLYDQSALLGLLQYWYGCSVIVAGRPSRFWRRAATKRRHPFFAHPLLSRFGGTLAAAARQRARERCPQKAVTCLPLLFSFQFVYVFMRLLMVEAPHRRRLIELAKRSASTLWGIPINRLEAKLVDKIAAGNRIPARSVRGVFWRVGVVSYGNVAFRGDTLIVSATAINWWLLPHELEKATAELICLHGLNTLSEAACQSVLDATDYIDYEPWMLQTGGELWRRLLAVIPSGRPVADVLMHIARLPPKSLESLIEAVIEKPQWARELLEALGNETELE